MQLSCLPVSLYADLSAGHLTIGEWFRRAGALGLDGADLSTLHLGRLSVDAVRQLRHEAADAGVAIPILVTYTDFTQFEADARSRERDSLRRWLEVSERLGVHAIRVTAGQARPGIPDRDGMGWVVEGLTACAADAASAGIRLLYENHVRGTPWTLNDFTQASSRFLEVARRTAPSEIGILFDTANNLAMNEPVLDVFDAVAHRIEAVHISDIARAGSFEPAVIGTGVAPIEDVVSHLVEGGFDGWISIEEASRTGPGAFTHAVHYVEQAWERAGGRARGRQR